MAYRITDQECGLYDENGEAQYRVVIQVDTAADVPSPKPEWMEGSMCLIAQTHTYKILNNAREWV